MKIMILSDTSMQLWRKALVNSGMQSLHVTKSLVQELESKGLTPDNMRNGTFIGYQVGESARHVGAAIAKEFAAMHIMQNFLNAVIDWEKAWESLMIHEGYFLVKTNEANLFGLFARTS